MKRFGVVIVGDEILSGRRVDKHLTKVIELLSARGLELSWAQYVGDDRPAITAVLERTMASDDVVFVTGGIGATPDDQTRQAAAAASGVEVVLHPEAKELIGQRIAQMNADAVAAGKTPLPLDSPEHLQRLRMGEFPAGSTIIPNPYNKIPGFFVGEHYFVPGFPVMAWPMLEWVLDTRYAPLFHQVARGTRSLIVFEQPESRVTPLMEAIEAAHPDVRVFSLPSVGDPAARDSSDPAIAQRARRHIELGVKGPAASLDAAFSMMEAGLHDLAAEFVVLAA
jgi:molybdopterin-biosynthesis enzyme MoeA-like protein